MFEEQMIALRDRLQSHLDGEPILTENRILATIMVNSINVLMSTRAKRQLNASEFHMYKGLLQDGASFLSSIGSVESAVVR
ncbi:hypothetical protein [Aeromonas hydrophila]|uniref:hypothetical protein n=1 Tax=Aeromonas hydrophila TaxID=644 RepID=UPI002B45EA93|nr:hypothetical protein [Aeromonas hydrophila]